MNFKKNIKKTFNVIKYYLWLSPFQKALLNSRFEKDGKITLFKKQFVYHYGLAFHETYKEIFQVEIYEFKTNSKKPVIIDCGANMGLSVLYFSKKYANSKIIAFEPDAAVLPYLIKNIEYQGIENVELHKKAVWIESTDLNFYTDNGLGGRVNNEYINQEPKRVEAVRLKDYLNEDIDMLKIDIEGPEYLILKDCEESLINVKNIFIEYHSNVNEEQYLDNILNILKKSGFRYHLKESFSRKKPFVDKTIVCEQFDMAINIFAYKYN